MIRSLAARVADASRRAQPLGRSALRDSAVHLPSTRANHHKPFSHVAQSPASGLWVDGPPAATGAHRGGRPAHASACRKPHSPSQAQPTADAKAAHIASVIARRRLGMAAGAIKERHTWEELQTVIGSKDPEALGILGRSQEQLDIYIQQRTEILKVGDATN